ncbi:MAG: SpoIIE family protein phosphatase [Deltaproteobacteria bacterium]|nr:SpoIIE family protein phosphatase [Deltaproteobacteria bacterium]
MLSTQEIVGILGRCDIFAGMAQDRLLDLAKSADVIDVKDGSRVFTEGEPGHDMHVVASGVVRIHRGEKALRQLAASSVFGEMALLDPGSKRAASATADGPAVLLRFDRETFMRIVENRPEVLLAMLREFSKRVNAYIFDLAQVRHVLEEVILPLGVALSSESVERLLERILIEAQRLTRADGGTLYLRRGEELAFTIMMCESLRVAKGTGFEEPITLAPLPLVGADGEPNLANIASFVTHMGYGINIPDVYEVKEFDFSGTRAFDKANNFRTRSCLTTPLRDHEKNVIGVLQLINARDGSGSPVPFSSYHELIVESLASQAAMALNTQNLLKRQRELARLEHDIHVARQIQADFLPDTIPQPEGYELDSRFRPARQVGGDFYDAFPTTGGRIGFVIADVCDKGVGAALFMALSRSLVRAFSWLDSAPSGSPELAAAAEPITRANDYITSFHNKMNMFVTLFYGVLDPATGAMQYINAGHNPPLVIGSNGKIKARLALTGPAVGMIPGAVFKTGQLQLEPGDVFYGYTDGVTEARDPTGGFWSEKKLQAVLSEIGNRTATDVLELVDTHLKAHVKDAEPSDDITMLAIRRKP